MGSQNCHHYSPETTLEEAIKAGITMFQFREKGEDSLCSTAKVELGKRLRYICYRYNIPFIVNDDVDLVDILLADGIHVGQEDKDVTEIRKQYPHKTIGLSLSNPQELKRSDLSVVDYVGAGPIFTTSTKVDAKRPVGLSWIKFLRETYPYLPIVGIGGINEINASTVLQTGADGVSVISAIADRLNINDAVNQL